MFNRQPLTSALQRHAGDGWCEMTMSSSLQLNQDRMKNNSRTLTRTHTHTHKNEDFTGEGMGLVCLILLLFFLIKLLPGLPQRFLRRQAFRDERGQRQAS